MVALIALWLVPARMSVAALTASGGADAMAQNLFRQTLGRFFLGVSHAKPPWYYAQTIAVDLFPWTLFLPFTIPYVWKHRKDNAAFRFLLSWIIPALLFFTLSAGKRALYLLPLFPALSIVIACSVIDLMEGV